MATRSLKPANAETVEDVLDTLDAEIGSISFDLVKALAEIEGATKDKVNPHFKSKYADIGSVIDAIKPVLAKHNLAFYQRPQPSEGGVLVQTMLRHISGCEVDLGTLYVPANKNDAQGFGSALTYARRYALMTAFGVPAEDDDGNAAAASTRANHHPDGGDATVPRGAGDMSDSALRGCVKSLVHSLNGCGNLEDFDELMAMSETVATIEQCKRRFPNWWSTGAGMPAEFKPLQKIINETREGLRALETQ